MLDQNRPYSAGDILNNLHKEFGKTCIQRTLDQLVSEGKLKEKAYGKQKVYVADQSQFPAVDEAELKKMDEQIATLQEKLKERQEKFHSLETELASLRSSLTSEEAKAQLALLEKECAQMTARLKSLKSGSSSVTPEESARIRKSHEEAVKQWRKRKRLLTDITDTIMEGYPKSKKQLYEELGIETDEDAGAKLPPT